jgi:CheY-like chemotaxis protein
MVASRSLRIVVVDDDPVVCDSLVAYLEDLDHEVTAAATGEEALDLISRARYDLAIVDLRLPGMDGEALITEAHERSPGLRFLVHTGSVNYRPSEEMHRCGLETRHVLWKPVADLGAFAKRIEELVAG